MATPSQIKWMNLGTLSIVISSRPTITLSMHRNMNRHRRGTTQTHNNSSNRFTTRTIKAGTPIHPTNGMKMERLPMAWIIPSTPSRIHTAQMTMPACIQLQTPMRMAARMVTTANNRSVEMPTTTVGLYLRRIFIHVTIYHAFRDLTLFTVEPIAKVIITRLRHIF
jgi:hypothetical protein